MQGQERVLVTGANGFIGSHLCERLSREGMEVHAVCRSRRPDNLGVLQWWQVDLSDEAHVRNTIAAARPDIIFHLASHVSGVPRREQVLPTFHCNLQSTVNILTVASECDCRRVVLAGSLAEPEVEKGERFPSSPYAAAKWASSAYAGMFHALYQLPVVIARVFMTYGPAQMDLTKLIPYVIVSTLQGKAAEISSGNRLVDWIYVSDVVDGLIALCHAPNVDGATIDLGSGSLVSIREVVQDVVRLTGGQAVFGAIPDRPLEPTRSAKTAETFGKIGWKAGVSLREGLQRTVNWYRKALKVTAELCAFAGVILAQNSVLSDFLASESVVSDLVTSIC